MSDIIKHINLEVGQAFDEMCTSINNNTVLEPKVKELVRLACVVTDRSNFGVQLHTIKAIGEGATKDEILGTVLNCLPVTGIESVVSAVSNVLTAFENYRGEK